MHHQPKNIISPGFDEILTMFLVGSDHVIKTVLDAGVSREPERYTDVRDLVQCGRLIPRILIQHGGLTIALIDAETNKSIGDVFYCMLPALKANGRAN